MNFTTIAYSTGTGRMAWLARHAGVGDFGAASALAIGPSGRVFVTGETGASDGCCTSARASTVATRRRELAVSPDSSKVHVTGDTATFGTTIGYGA